MNWIAKLLIILTAIIAVLLGILFFIKTIVSPPQLIEFSNQHLTNLQKDVAIMKGTLDMKKSDSILFTTLNAIQLFQDEGFVDTIHSDQIKQLLVTNYVPSFVKSYKNYFSNSEWSSSQRKELRQKAKMLIEMNRQTNGMPILDDSLKRQVDSLNIILKQYDEAEELCKNAYFINILESERTINLAKKYASTVPLSNCTSLVKRLNAISEKLESSHYKELKNMVDELDLYSFYSKKYYQNTLAPKVYAAITEYKENAQRIYGTSRSTLLFENQAKEKYNIASDYYGSDDYQEE